MSPRYLREVGKEYDVMFRIFLVRHGESEGNVDKSVHEKMADHAIPLSENG